MDLLQLKSKVISCQINPLLSDLPDWVEGFRPHQIKAVESVLDAFTRVPVVVLDAPTGAGKTLIAETVRRIRQNRALYVCSTKSLQDQFSRDFDYARVLKGRSNYPTTNFPGQFPELSAADCLGTKNNPECRWCGFKSNCLYEQDKAAALHSQLAVVNTAYLLAEANGPGRFSGFPLVIADESDTLESELMRYVSVEISPGRMKRYGWDPPRKVTVESSWKDWIEGRLPEIVKLEQALPSDDEDIAAHKEHRYLANLYARLAAVKEGLASLDSPWVYTGKEGRVAFKPSRVDQMGKEVLWSHGRSWLLMSATVISAGELLGSLGYDGEWELVKVPSTFDKRNRKIVVAPIANMARNGGKEEADQHRNLEALREGLLSISARHPKERMLLHTVSYALSDTVAAIMAETRRPIFTYFDTTAKDRALDSFLYAEGGVLVAPSMERGIDLPGDSCRVQVVVKCPFPYLGDRQISQRLYGSRDGQTWYTVQTVRSLVQMTGRAVRSKDDWAVTYILDSQFVNQLWNRGRLLFPSWWREALEFRGSV